MHGAIIEYIDYKAWWSKNPDHFSIHFNSLETPK